MLISLYQNLLGVSAIPRLLLLLFLSELLFWGTQVVQLIFVNILLLVFGATEMGFAPIWRKLRISMIVLESTHPSGMLNI